jgi:hypothetical protein
MPGTNTLVHYKKLANNGQKTFAPGGNGREKMFLIWIVQICPKLIGIF